MQAVKAVLDGLDAAGRFVMIAHSMPARFCPQCGTRTSPAARFCSDCGTNLTTGTPTVQAGRGVRSAGAIVFSGFVLAGLAIWAAILTPTPPRPAPGAGRPAATAGAATAETTGAGHPKVDLPPEAKKLLEDIAKKAADNPDDLAAWIRSGQAHYRAAQLDPAYRQTALAAFEHVLARDPKSPEALRGKANVLYDQQEFAKAIVTYQAYLALRPDDNSARTDLGTMYFYGGDATKAIATYRDVLTRDPNFIQAHVNLGVTLHQQGDHAGALASLKKARELATDDPTRQQIDEMITGLGGGARAEGGGEASATDRTPFQAAVEDALRAHQIVGPKITRFEWTGAATGRLLLHDFPMDAMPPFARDKFITRIKDTLRDAKDANGVTDTPSLEIADAASGRVMLTVTP